MWWATRLKQPEGRTVVPPRTPFPRALALNPLLGYLLQIPRHASAVCRSVLPDDQQARPKLLLIRAWKSQEQERKKRQFGFYITGLGSIPAYLSVYEVCTRISICLGGTLFSVAQATSLCLFLGDLTRETGVPFDNKSRTLHSLARGDVFV